MKQELERYEKNDEQLRLELSELKLKIEAKKAEIETRTKQLEDVKQITRQFKMEAHTVHQKLHEDENKDVKKRKQFAPALAAFDRKYVGDESQGASSQKKSKVTDIQVERNRERDALERNITAIARRINRGDEEHARQHHRMMEENVMLMTQISELRRQNENLLKRQRVLEESSKSAYSAEELNKILEMQKDRIAQLTEQLKQLQLRGNVSRRVAASRERLPPMNAVEGIP
jgi:chromosome segregation ATPase